MTSATGRDPVLLFCMSPSLRRVRSMQCVVACWVLRVYAALLLASHCMLQPAVAAEHNT
jgi:hypothetical protein